MDILRFLQVAAVTLLLVVSGFYAIIMFDVASLTSEVAGSLRGPTDPLQGRLDIQNTRMQEGDKGPLKGGYVALADYRNIDAGRRLVVSLPVPKRDLFGDGETMPAPDMLDVFLAGSAPAVAQAECELLLATIASGCRVERAGAKGIKGMPDLVEVTMRLSFTEKEERGAFPGDGPLYYDEVSADVVAAAGIADTVGLSGLQEARIRLYEGAEKACAEMRRRQGNCSVTDLHIGAHWNARNRAVSLNARAMLSYVSNRTI